MVNYNKSTIYKLCCNDLEIKEIYIGSTTNFNKRRNAHKTDCNNEKSKNYNLYVYQFIRSNGCFQNWSMVEIELFNARDKKNLCRRERFWIESEKASLNSYRACRTEEEKIEENKAKTAEYYANNKDKMKENAAEYYANNKDTIIANAAEYHQKNKEQIKARKTEKIECICGSIISKGNISKHKKAKKHIRFLEQQ